MPAPVLPVVLAPALVGAATLVARHRSPRAGGLVSAFPAIVGPVLLIDSHVHGAAFAARAATGTLLGLVALSGFALAYSRVAVREGWAVSLAAGWIAAAALALAVSGVAVGALLATTIASLSLLLALRGLPRRAAPIRASSSPPWDLPVRMALTAVLVVTLAAAATALGPVPGGVLAALPVLASILAVFTHAQAGAEALNALLRGMLVGMAGFVAFCAVVAALIESSGVPVAFAGALVAALGTHALAALAGEH